MKRSLKVVGIAALSVFGFAVVFILYWLLATKVFGHRYVVDLSLSRSFTIDMPFVPLRKILVQTDAASDIINAGEHSQLISKTTSDRQGHVNHILAPFQSWEGSEVNALMLQITDPYIGTRNAPFTQHVSVTPGSIHSVIKLNQPEGPLLGYTVTTHIGGDGNGSKFDTTLEMKIDTPAPWLTHWFARMRVRNTMRRTLRAQEAQIEAAVKKHGGQF